MNAAKWITASGLIWRINSVSASVWQQIQLEQPAVRDVVPLPFREIVDDGDVIALIQKEAHGVRPDISGAAGY